MVVRLSSLSRTPSMEGFGGQVRVYNHVHVCRKRGDCVCIVHQESLIVTKNILPGYESSCPYVQPRASVVDIKCIMLHTRMHNLAW